VLLLLVAVALPSVECGRYRSRGRGHYGAMYTAQQPMSAQEDPLQREVAQWVARTASMVVESGRGKSPCVCAGFCSTHADAEQMCQDCQLFMGFFNGIVSRVVANKERSGTYSAIMQAMNEVDERAISKMSVKVASVACAEVAVELEQMITISPAEAELARLLPPQAGYHQSLRTVSSMCANDQIKRKLTCIGGLPHLQITKALFPLFMPNIDGGRTLTEFTKQFLSDLTAGSGNYQAAAQSLTQQSPGFANVRHTFNSLLCQHARVPLSKCGLANPAFLQIAGHRGGKALLAPQYKDLQLILSKAESSPTSGMSGNSGYNSVSFGGRFSRRAYASPYHHGLFGGMRAFEEKPYNEDGDWFDNDDLAVPSVNSFDDFLEEAGNLAYTEALTPYVGSNYAGAIANFIMARGGDDDDDCDLV